MNYLRKLSAVAVFVVAATLTGCGSDAGNSSAPTTHAAPGIALPAGIKQAGVVNVAGYMAFPPYRYLDASGKPAGFEIDLAKAVAGKLGVKIEFHSVEFPALIPSISNGRYDWSLGTLSDTEERRKVVDILDWARPAYVVQVQGGNPHGVDPAQLCGVTFGHLQGSAQASAFDLIAADCAKRGAPAPKQILFQDPGTQMQALQNNRFDAALQNPPAGAQTQRETKGALVVLPGKVSTIPVDPSGWVFAKGNTELEKAVSQAIQSLIQDGTWAKMLKDNDFLDYAIVPPTLNTKPTTF
ncbi:transporter substrate-binding domain-containing protein [Arthrobacter bambusae]|uniref:Polar amino acid transport system substrate-binding protein n=1 Tax=Arthrobacter bambusae TaxID=1338426 RepID=A0AAW8DHM9_9MICC|nr:transporter substrate-binding domain-containing protein [Arthrobacter bambusae]MDP9906178.1 polar amino acid transport system substrate-binding protein [Arthrobacter bambusae]MDQ0130589.1 polar amino acid transport system substrate-binding protein [Arthrobacter bambusae]MDQ0182264.1 polar amino acid transport system substrate-binding protein [Arthrobacter bambusae]